jgi:hypothetical protein
MIIFPAAKLRKRTDAQRKRTNYAEKVGRSSEIEISTTIPCTPVKAIEVTFKLLGDVAKTVSPPPPPTPMLNARVPNPQSISIASTRCTDLSNAPQPMADPRKQLPKPSLIRTYHVLRSMARLSGARFDRNASSKKLRLGQLFDRAYLENRGRATSRKKLAAITARNGASAARTRNARRDDAARVPRGCHAAHQHDWPRLDILSARLAHDNSNCTNMCGRRKHYLLCERKIRSGTRTPRPSF